MKRELFLIQSENHLAEFLSHENQADGMMGVGYYSVTHAAPPFNGVELRVLPPYLKPKVLGHIERGEFSPAENEPFFIAGSLAGEGLALTLPARTPSRAERYTISRWLLMAAHPFQKKSERSDEPLQDLLRSTFSKIMELRPNTIVFLVDVELLGHWLHAIGHSANAEEIRRAMMTWMVEECVHPRIALQCRNREDFDSFTAISRRLRFESPVASQVEFQL